MSLIQFSCALHTKWPRAFPQAEFLSIYRFILRSEKRVPLILEFRLAGSDESYELNKVYRKKAKKTDVLSFPARSSTQLGSLLIDEEVARAQASELGHSLKREIHELFVHGVLHLLGYDHDHPHDRGRMARREYQIREKFLDRKIRYPLV